MKGRWVKDICPYAKDQGFNSVIGDVRPGEKIFGFTVTSTSTDMTLTLKTVTGGKVTQMHDLNYRVIPVKVDTGSVAAVAYIKTKAKTSFHLCAENNKIYDIVVIGRVLY